MRKRRGLVLVLFSLCMGGVAAWAANDWVSERINAGNDNGDTVPVIAAAMEIPYGTKIEGRHLKVISVPSEDFPKTAFNAITDVEGKVATVDVERGEVLSSSRLADHAGGSTLAALVAKNMRAVTVRVDDVIGVAGFLLPGNKVDVLATKMDRGARSAKTETILRNIKVLAVDQTAATQQNEPVIVRAVTLELTPRQSEDIVKAKEEGSIQLTLRNPLDEATQVAKAEPATVKKAPAVIARRSSAPVRRRAVDTTVTVIRGTHVDKLKTKS